MLLLLLILCYVPFFAISIKVVFIGASITGQRPGYVDEIQKFFPDWTIARYGYPGSYFSLCLFEQILEENPKIVFIDWSINAGGNIFTMIGDVKAMIWKLNAIKALPVFLHMPRVDGINHAIIDSINQLSTKLNFTVIDLRYQFTFEELKIYLRDNCHTNHLGSAAYGKILFDILKKTEIKVPCEFQIANQYSQKINTYNLSQIVHKSLEFFINGSILGMLGKIGPYSNYLQVNINNIRKKTVRLWDMHCHYERYQFLNFFENFSEVTKLSYLILNLNFSRHDCRRNVSWDWSLFVPKFEISFFCYTGSITQLAIDK